MLESQFGEKVGDKMKIAIMTSMLPPVIQDFAYQNVTRDMLFENLLEKIGVRVGNRVAMNEGEHTHGHRGGWVERLQQERGARGCRWGLVEVQSVLVGGGCVCGWRARETMNLAWTRMSKNK